MKFVLFSTAAAAILLSAPANAQSGSVGTQTNSNAGKTVSPAIVGTDNTTANKDGFDNGGQKQDAIMTGSVAASSVSGQTGRSTTTRSVMDAHQVDIAAANAAGETANEDEFDSRN
jgi:hypothetical protein